MRYLFIAITCVLAGKMSRAQVIDDTEEARRQFLAETKQIDQFIQRFNGEETESGKRISESSKEYRSPRLRSEFIPVLIDQSNKGLGKDLKESFISRVIRKDDPAFLDIHEPGWFAEVESRFLFKGVEKPLTLFLKLEPSGEGYKWIINHIFFEDFQRTLDKDTIPNIQFLHPLSHEIDFINLNKALKGGLKPFLPDDFKPDMLSLFNYEMAQGNLKFLTIRDVKFHFFQVDGWYFEISNYNRPGYNRGWLISNLVPYQNDKEKKLLEDFILIK